MTIAEGLGCVSLVGVGIREWITLSCETHPLSGHLHVHIHVVIQPMQLGCRTNGLNDNGFRFISHQLGSAQFCCTLLPRRDVDKVGSRLKSCNTFFGMRSVKALQAMTKWSILINIFIRTTGVYYRYITLGSMCVCQSLACSSLWSYHFERIFYEMKAEMKSN